MAKYKNTEDFRSSQAFRETYREALKQIQATSKIAVPPQPSSPSPGVFAGSVVTSGVTPSASPAPSMPFFVRCLDCGAAVWNDMTVEHEEWHETITLAIREQIEEAMNDNRLGLDEDSPVLGRCMHGIDLDNSFCPSGCRK